MNQDEEEIRRLIEEWASAVHRGDLAAVVRDHADDLVMYDVPPPYEGLRGLDAYRAVWPGFFAWQASGAEFTLDTLDVTALPGRRVRPRPPALRHPEELAERPALRLRLTLGLRKEDGRWVVAHEHHSFPDLSSEPGPSSSS